MHSTYKSILLFTTQCLSLTISSLSTCSMWEHSIFAPRGTWRWWAVHGENSGNCGAYWRNLYTLYISCTAMLLQFTHCKFLIMQHEEATAFFTSGLESKNWSCPHSTSDIFLIERSWSPRGLTKYKHCPVIASFKPSVTKTFLILSVFGKTLPDSENRKAIITQWNLHHFSVVTHDSG